MSDFKKLFNFRLTFLIIGIVFLCTGTLYPSPFSNDSLRIPVGQVETFVRIKSVLIREALEQYPEERAYLFDPKNTTLLLVALGVKPAYWSWSWAGKTEEELQMIQNISRMLGLRFVSYKSVDGHDLCFVYDVKALAGVFFRNRDRLLERDAYLGREVSPETYVSLFEDIDLQVILRARSLAETEGALARLDRYLIGVGRTRAEIRNNNYEPFPVGLAMGYSPSDVSYYLELRKDMLLVGDRIAWAVSEEHDIRIASVDEESARVLLGQWLEARKVAEEIIGISSAADFPGRETPEDEIKLALQPPGAATETERVLVVRKKLSSLVDSGDSAAIEDIILQQDRELEEDKDWVLLTEAVAARNQLGLSKDDYIRNKYQINLHWCPSNQGRRDLHMHTTLSDGQVDIEEAIKELVRNVVKVAAVSDHHVLCGIDRCVELGKEYGIEIIPAVEFYCHTEVDQPRGTGITGDIVAYFIDPNDPRLIEVVEENSRRTQLAFYSHTMNMLDYLEARGELDAALAELPEYQGLTPNEIIQRLLVTQARHYVEVYRRNGLERMARRVEEGLALLTDEDFSNFNTLLRRVYSASYPYLLTVEDSNILQRLILIQTSETATTIAFLWKDALEKYIVDIDDADKPERNVWGWTNIVNPNIPLIMDDPEELIRIIHQAGGIAVFAHPRWYPDVVLPRGGWDGDGYALVASYIRELAVKGIDGLEVYTHWLDKEKDGYYLSLAEELGLPVSYGTDCHFTGNETLALGIDGTFYMPYPALAELKRKAQEYRRVGDLIREGLPQRMQGYLNIPNLPSGSHREGPLLIDHLQAMLDVLNGVETNMMIPARYRRILSAPENRRFFESFIELHDVGKFTVYAARDDDELTSYPGHEERSVQILQEDADLARGLENRELLIDVIRLHGLIYELSKSEDITSQVMADFIEEHAIGERVDEVMPLLIACGFLDVLGTDRGEDGNIQAANRMRAVAEAYELFLTTKARSGEVFAESAEEAVQTKLAEFGPVRSADAIETASMRTTPVDTSTAVSLNELKQTVILFPGDAVMSHPAGFEQALDQLDETNTIVVLTDLRQDLMDFCIDHGIDLGRFFIRTPSEIGLSGFDLNQAMSLIMGIDNLRCIPLTDSICEQFPALLAAQDKV